MLMMSPWFHRYDARFHRNAALLATAGAVSTVLHVAGQKASRGLPIHIHGSVYTAELIAWSVWAVLSPAIAFFARRFAPGVPLYQLIPVHAALLFGFITLHAALHIMVRVSLRGDWAAFRKFPQLVWYRMFFSFSQEVLFYIAVVSLTWLMVRRETHVEATPAPAAPPGHIPVKKESATLLIPVAEIDWLEAERNYVRLHTCAGQSHLVRETLSSLSERLAPAGFVRVHRSASVRADRIREYRPLFQGDGELVLRNGQIVPVGRKWKSSVTGLLG